MEEFFATARALVVGIRDGLPIVGEVIIDIDFVKTINATIESFLQDLILRQLGFALGKYMM